MLEVVVKRGRFLAVENRSDFDPNDPDVLALSLRDLSDAAFPGLDPQFRTVCVEPLEVRPSLVR